MAGIPTGEFFVTRMGDDLRIERADSKILITAELLTEIARNDPDYPVTRSVDGDMRVLRIKATNRTVIYRIGEYVPQQDAYIAEWPD
jgi:hypothetical protein